MSFQHSSSVAFVVTIFFAFPHFLWGQVQQNSTKKIRVVPSAQAKRIGGAIHWEPTVDAALAKSQLTKKPVFWYVPTLEGSFMDRKAEIDRYMLAGPFSWRPTVQYINTNFVPVRAEPTRQQQKKYGLTAYNFIEPGFVILKPDSKLELKVDRITTLHPQWFNDVLFRVAKTDKFDINQLPDYWKKFRNGEFQQVAKLENDEAEAQLFKGMALFRLGRHDEAKSTWREISNQFADDPLAWKAAAEAEGIGPFCRGFEVHTAIPNDYSQRPVEKGTAALQNTLTEGQLWSMGIRFILGMQNSDGGFRDSDYDFGGTDSLPNVHVAVTSLAAMALLKRFQSDDVAESEKRTLASAIQRASTFVSDSKNVNRFDRDELLWAYAYRLRLLLEVRANLADLKQYHESVQELDSDIRTAITSLENIQSRRGSWYHEYSNPFVTATALTGLHHAKTAGFDVNMEKIKLGVAALSRERMKNGAFPYFNTNAGPKEGTLNDVAKAAGRMPLCELGLHYWGASSEAKMVAAIERSLELQDNLNIALKYDDHTSNLSYGGFFFWYDMRARSEAIGQIKAEEIANKFKTSHRKIILGLPEIDGCFVDSHELGRVYGTAMALLSLAESR